MAAIAHAFTAQLTNQTTTSSGYVDVSGAAITSGNFTAGKKYLIHITAHVSAGTGTIMGVKTLHGTTDFAESEFLSWNAGNPERATYWFFTVWTAVSGEGIKLQFKEVLGTGFAVAIDQISMLAINLSDDVTENTDWFFGESATDLGLTTTFQDGGSVTFTPSGASDWLVMTYAQVDITATTTSPISRINRSGEASSTLPEARYESGRNEARWVFGLARVFALAAASNTFKEQSADNTGNNHTRFHSSVFALNLNKFRNHSNAYTEADTSLSATDYATQLQTISITPDVAGDVWIGTYWGFDRAANAREAEFRIQVDNADDPAGQTTDNYQFQAGGDATDEEPHGLMTISNLTAAAHTIDLDASSDATTSTPTGQEASNWAVTMELAAATPPISWLSVLPTHFPLEWASAEY